MYPYFIFRVINLTINFAKLDFAAREFDLLNFIIETVAVARGRPLERAVAALARPPGPALRRPGRELESKPSPD